VLPTRPVLITGAIPEEPAITQVVTAGSGVSCGFVLPDADACGVAFRVALRRAPLPFPRAVFLRRFPFGRGEWRSGAESRAGAV
jgi:hypothetical protein